MEFKRLVILTTWGAAVWDDYSSKLKSLKKQREKKSISLLYLGKISWLTFMSTACESAVDRLNSATCFRCCRLRKITWSIQVFHKRHLCLRSDLAQGLVDEPGCTPGCENLMAQVFGVGVLGERSAVGRVPVPLKHSPQLGLDRWRRGHGRGLVDN